MRKLVRTLVRVVVAMAALRVVGALVSRAYEGEGTASDDDFKLMALIGGRLMISEAAALRTGTAVAVMGGVNLDLTYATIDPGGAHVSLKAYMSGIRMVVPAGWKVYVDEDVRAGGIENETADPESLPDDAPRLTVDAMAVSGGILITTG